MPQVTIYLDDDALKRVKAAAAAAGVSVSRWVSEAVREKTETTWPESVLALAGAWPDFPLAEELRSDQPPDSEREKF